MESPLSLEEQKILAAVVASASRHDDERQPYASQFSIQNYLGGDIDALESLHAKSMVKIDKDGGSITLTQEGKQALYSILQENDIVYTYNDLRLKNAVKGKTWHELVEHINFMPGQINKIFEPSLYTPMPLCLDVGMSVPDIAAQEREQNNKMEEHLYLFRKGIYQLLEFKEKMQLRESDPQQALKETDANRQSFRDTQAIRALNNNTSQHSI